MSGLRLGLFAVAWVFASVAIGVVTAILVTEALSLIGIVDSGESSYSVSLNVISVVVFVGVVAVPVVFRERFVDAGVNGES
ncbi:MAG: hypothetical protein BMS9Abin17_0462 [Acidimicrobiia bacterium]|nr:MAG: hypothetical protein BMS9Abin17_0462 [Acidimicrobiia bacterium]